MTFLRIVSTLYLFDLSMIFSENRSPLFRIMLWAYRGWSGLASAALPVRWRAFNGKHLTVFLRLVTLRQSE
ncbi:hypothetical protein [Bradyrhizobium sp. McL0615]|uniref:hypothetical protein n=1 Tax=Bradyrhizobium sp. McL0615 TaxID=3415673 RepID=UPI003CF941DD